MKKLAAALIALLFTAFSSNAQDSLQEKKLKNELVMDITRATTIVINPSLFNSNGYGLFYRRHFKNTAIRIGIGGSSYGQSYQDKRDTLVSSGKEYNLRINFGTGLEWNHLLSKRWNLIYGGDIIFSNRTGNFHYKQENYPYYTVVTTENSNQLSIAPFFGIRFNVGRRISFSTEISVISGYYERVSKTDYENPLINDRISLTKGTQMSVGKSVFLHFYF